MTAGLAAVAASAFGQTAPEPDGRVFRTDQRVVLDGRFDEPAWAAAAPIDDFTQRDPTEGAPASERTVVRLLATPNGLAIGVSAFDREPAGIRRSQLRRDASLDTDDQFSVIVDAQRDRRSGFIFSVNPNAALVDSELLTFESENRSWDGVWDARALITSEGWFAEILIPWSTLRYRQTDDAFGMNFRRFIRRKNEEVLWRAFRRPEGIRFLEREGIVSGLAALPRRARVELRPFGLLTGSLDARASDGRVTESAGVEPRAGLDAKVGLTPALTLDLTTFTDFAQAEVDRQIVNLTRFPLFFPEQRTFFTEGAGIFDFGRQGQTQLFYSRRIGLARDGSAIPLIAGARVQGRAGRQQIGLLAVRTGGDEDALDVVGRVKRDVLGRGYVGAMATAKAVDGRPASVSSGADFNLPYIVKGQNLVVLGSTAWHAGGDGGPRGNHTRLMLDFPNDWADIVARVDRVDAGFDPALGFVQQSGIWRYGGSVNYTPRPRRWGIRRFDFDFLSYNVVTDLAGRLDNANYEVRPLGADFERGDSIEVNLQFNQDRPDQPFELFPGTTMAAGAYDWRRVEVEYSGTNAWRLVPEVTVSTGEFYDGHGTDVEVGLRYALPPHVLLSVEVLNQQWSRVGSAFEARTARVRLDYAVSPRLNVTWFGQYDNESERASVNARLRWTRRPGSDLYIVYNSTWPTPAVGGVPWRRPLNGGVVVKYVHYVRM